MSEMDDLDRLSPATLAYFQARQRNRLYDLVMSRFRAAKISQAQLGRRMGRKPEVVNRMLAGPGNWRLDTLSDLLLAIAGEEIDATSSSPMDKPGVER